MPRARGATVKDIAQRANVSSGTVSRVLNNRANVAGDLRARVLRAVADLGYAIPSVRPPAPAPPEPTLRAIGFLLTLPYLGARSDLMAPFWANVLNGAEMEAARHGGQVTYRSMPGSGVTPQEALARIGDLGLDATLLVGAPSAEVVEAVELLGIPVTLVDTQIEGGRVHDAVLPDYADGSRRLTEELLAAGHRDIAFIGGPLAEGSRIRNAIPAIEARARGVRDVLAYAGLPFQADLLQSCDLTQDGGRAAAHRLIAAGRRFTAIFCANDVAASGALLALREAGLCVPDDVSVVGAGDELGAHTFPPLTTFSLDLATVGAISVERLFARSRDPQATGVTTLVPVEVVRRSSIAAPRTK